MAANCAANAVLSAIGNTFALSTAAQSAASTMDASNTGVQGVVEALTSFLTSGTGLFVVGGVVIVIAGGIYAVITRKQSAS